MKDEVGKQASPLPADANHKVNVFLLATHVLGEAVR